MTSATYSERERLERALLLARELKRRKPWSPLAGPQTMAYESTADIVGYGGAAGGGKGLALDTPIPTPTGWTQMGNIAPGDELFDESGNVCRVTAVSEINLRPCYRLTFDDGSTIVADDVHRWVTLDSQDNVQRMRDTNELAATVLDESGKPRHSVWVKGFLATKINPERFLTGCEPISPVPTRCISVDSATRQYLAGVGFIPTHNTDLVCGKAVTKHKRVLVIRREKAQTEGIIQRMSEIIGNTDGLNSQKGIWKTSVGMAPLIEFGGLDNPGDERRWQGRPHDLKCFDEATEMREDQVRFIMGWTRTSDPSLHPQVVMTFNPPTTTEGRWIIKFFAPWLDKQHPNPAKPGELRWFTTIGDDHDYEVPDGRPFVLLEDGTFEYDFDPADYSPEKIIRPKSRTFIPARVTDNKFYMASGYVSQLQSLPEPLRSQMLYGDFNAGVEDDPWQVIPTAWVEMAMARWQDLQVKPRMDSLGVDVARGGRDNTVIARRHGNWYDRPLTYPGSQTPNGPSVAGLVIGAMRDRAPVHIDVIGVGSSPYDFLVQAGQQVLGVNVAEKATRTDKSGRLHFANLRSQLWWMFREALDPDSNTGIALPPDNRLKADLCAPLWRMKGATIQVESREEIIDRIGRSPDYAAAYTLAQLDTPRQSDLPGYSPQERRRKDYDPYA